MPLLPVQRLRIAAIRDCVEWRFAGAQDGRAHVRTARQVDRSRNLVCSEFTFLD